MRKYEESTWYIVSTQQMLVTIMNIISVKGIKHQTCSQNALVLCSISALMWPYGLAEVSLLV